MYIILGGYSVPFWIPDNREMNLGDDMNVINHPQIYLEC